MTVSTVEQEVRMWALEQVDARRDFASLDHAASVIAVAAAYAGWVLGHAADPANVVPVMGRSIDTPADPVTGIHVPSPVPPAPPEAAKANAYILATRDTGFWLVGPFADRAAARQWGDNTARNIFGDPRWQVISLDNAPASVPLLAPDTAARSAMWEAWYARMHATGAALTGAAPVARLPLERHASVSANLGAA